MVSWSSPDLLVFKIALLYPNTVMNDYKIELLFAVAGVIDGFEDIFAIRRRFSKYTRESREISPHVESWKQNTEWTTFE